jgi:hypothetical protein
VLEARLRGTTPEQQAADCAAKLREMQAAHERENKVVQTMEQRVEFEREKSAHAKFAGRLQELTMFLAERSDKLMEKTQRNETEMATIRAKLERREQRARQIQQELEETKAKKPFR